MVRKQRKRISYVLPLANDAGGHRLGVNGLAVDSINSVLYSGGRDGVICAWDLNLDLTPFSDRYAVPNPRGDSKSEKPPATNFRQQVQAHTHWINDIALVQNNEALVSASSDITVKLWRPDAQDVLRPQTIGLHEDYVKTLASPGGNADWVASGGLDRKIYLWDLNGGGKKLRIDVGEDESTAKGSVYALACTSTLLASGGPESIVRVWDPRTGKRITKFVGHTDNIRDVLISQDGDTVMTASSDQTVKVWSMTAGRCMNTLTMHNDSVWSLSSDHPRLSVFYSSDRSGMVAKTDTRGCVEIDDGVSVAVCQEHEGVNKVTHAGNYLWTATSSSSINRWTDVDMDTEVQIPESYSFHRVSIATTRSRIPSPPQPPSPPPVPTNTNAKIPFQSLLRISNAAPFYVRNRQDSYSGAASLRKASDPFIEFDVGGINAVRSLPEYTIEGQHGLIKHLTLNDRRRVLTLDTNSEVVLWDLIQCVPVKAFGKRHLDDVFKAINTIESVAHWCAVDTRTGSLTCVLEENTCFDAEMYADELRISEHIEFREDQRINLGKWVLRYLFDNLIGEEIKRDEAFRHSLMAAKYDGLSRPGSPRSIPMPNAAITSWYDSSGPTSADTLKAPNGFQFPMNTPGMMIGLATPGPVPTFPSAGQHSTLSSTAEEDETLSRTAIDQGIHSPSEKHSADYFSAQSNAGAGIATTPGGTSNGPVPDTSSDAPPPVSPNPDAQVPVTPGEKTGMFGKKMWKNFGMKGLKKTTTNEASKPAVVEEKSEDSDSRPSQADDAISIEDNFFGVIQKMRSDYEAQYAAFERREKEEKVQTDQQAIMKLESYIQPSLPNDTPVLKLPSNTVILIQEDRVDSGGVADLFEGTVGSLKGTADLIEKVAPTWLAEVLLKNTIPLKEIMKVSFILEPFQNLLPSIATDGNTRLNANRMLRARKILAYVAERIEPQQTEQEDPNALRPEDYLELYCQDKLIPPTMTLATIRAHVWRGGGDVLLYYKSNGRKEIRHTKNMLGPHLHPASATPPPHTHTPAPPAAPPQQTLPAPPPLPAHARTPSLNGSHRSQRSQGSTHDFREPKRSHDYGASPKTSHDLPPLAAPAQGRFSEDSAAAARARPPTSGSMGVKKPEGNWI